MPHVCGDEPSADFLCGTMADVCPTYVGMNRPLSEWDTAGVGMPHVCGDEPCANAPKHREIAYAPRMWG